MARTPPSIMESRLDRLDAQLDDALDGTFPASDPVSFLAPSAPRRSTPASPVQYPSPAGCEAVPQD